MKKVFEPVTDGIKTTSEDLTGTMMLDSKQNNKALENLNDKLLEIMNDRGILATYLMSPLSKITNPETTTQFKLVSDSNSIRVIDLLIHNTKPVIFNDNLLTFRDTGKIFELKGHLVKMITNINYSVDLASLLDKKLVYDFAKELNFDVTAQSNKSNTDKTLMKLLESQGLMISASGVSNTIFLPSDPDKLCDRLKLLLQQKQAGNKSDIINQENFVIVDKLFEYKGISRKQHKQLSTKGNLLHEQV